MTINNLEAMTLGEHGYMSFVPNSKEHIFNTGTIIRVGERVGVLDMTRNIEKLPTNIHTASKLLIFDISNTLFKLGVSMKRGEFPLDIRAITGISHFLGTNTAQLLGFEITEPSFADKVRSTLGAVAYSKSGGSLLHEAVLKYRKTRQFWIEHQDIIKNINNYYAISRKFSPQ